MKNNEALAKETFNKTWEYIDMKERTVEQDMTMIHLAHTSCYLWSTCGTQLNVARGEWQISRVYAILNMGESALVHANRYLELCEVNDFDSFDFAFAYEAIARAYKIMDDEDFDSIKALALDHASKIEDKDNREYTISEINNI